jgi:hypothetical protein
MRVLDYLGHGKLVLSKREGGVYGGTKEGFITTPYLLRQLYSKEDLTTRSRIGLNFCTG